MTWLKIDDGEGMAPWVLQVGNEAYGVYVRLGTYCADHLTDGVVPAQIAEMIAGDAQPAESDPTKKISRNLSLLQLVGRITCDDMGTVRLPYFLDHNPTRAQVDADAEQRRERAQKAAAARWSGRRRPRAVIPT